jgi:hypothetical protein
MLPNESPYIIILPLGAIKAVKCQNVELYMLKKPTVLCTYIRTSDIKAHYQHLRNLHEYNTILKSMIQSYTYYLHTTRILC